MMANRAYHFKDVAYFYYSARDYNYSDGSFLNVSGKIDILITDKKIDFDVFYENEDNPRQSSLIVTNKFEDTDSHNNKIMVYKGYYAEDSTRTTITFELSKKYASITRMYYSKTFYDFFGQYARAEKMKGLLQSLLFIFLGATFGLCGENGNNPRLSEYFDGQKYDGDGFSLYPSQFVIHYDEGDFSYTILLKEDEDALRRLIRVINRAERTQQAEWPSIQRKIALCDGATCEDTLILDVRENDSLLVKANIRGEMYDLVAYYSTITSSNVLIWIFSTSSIWGVFLVGIIGFVRSYKKRAKNLKKEIPIYSALKKQEEDM